MSALCHQGLDRFEFAYLMVCFPECVTAKFIDIYALTNSAIKAAWRGFNTDGQRHSREAEPLFTGLFHQEVVYVLFKASLTSA